MWRDGDDSVQRILMLTTNFPRHVRGDTTGTFVYDLAEDLARKHDVLVIAPHDDADSSGHETISPRLTVRRLRYFWPRHLQRLAYGFGIPDNLRRSWLARIQLPLLVLSFVVAAIKHARDCDVVVCHWSLTALAALPARWLWSIPVILVIHGGDVRMAPRAVTRWLTGRVDWIVSAHDDLIDYVDSLNVSTPVLRIRNLTGIAPSLDEPARAILRKQLGLRANPLVLFVGRLTEFKDPLTFIDAVPHVMEREPQARFLLVGDGPLRDRIEERIRDLELTEYVTLAGHRPNVLEILQLATVFVATSPVTNLWSTTLLEAMHTGVPCIVTDAGGAADVLTHGVDSILVPPSDPNALAAAIVDLLHNEHLRDQLTEGATNLMKRQGFLREDISAEWSHLIAMATATP